MNKEKAKYFVKFYKTHHTLGISNDARTVLGIFFTPVVAASHIIENLPLDLRHRSSLS